MQNKITNIFPILKKVRLRIEMIKTWPFLLLFCFATATARSDNLRPYVTDLAQQPQGLRGLLVAVNETVLGSQIDGLIKSFTLRKGDRFQSGQTLIVFDCAVQHAWLAKSEAEMDAALATLMVQQQLQTLQSGSELEQRLARANVAKAKADLAEKQATLAMCTIKAPFNGRVVENKVQPYQVVARGQPLLAILDDTIFEVQLFVPSRWLLWLKTGLRFSIDVDETGKQYLTHIIRIGARIEPASQTIEIIGEIDGSHPELIAGMSGFAALPIPPGYSIK